MFTYDAVTAYVITRENRMITAYPSFHEAVKHAKDGDRIQMVTGTGNSTIHNHACLHPGCNGVVAPFPEARCNQCRSN